MEKYIAFGLYQKNELGGHQEAIGPNDPKAGEAKAVYLADDVHSLLTMLRGEIVSQSGLRTPDQDWSAAMDAIDKSLMEG